MTREQSHVEYSKLIEDCDSLIKLGKINAASSMITQLNLSHVPRASRQEVAKICRRMGLVEQGLHLLHPIVRNTKDLLQSATAGEISEYAILLSRNGSIEEALNLLRTVEPSEVPEALLYRSFCHISKWDYSPAADLLRQYLQSNPSEYSKLTAQVNLASALVELSSDEEAFEVLSETLSSAEHRGALRLMGNCFELRGRLHLKAGSLENAKTDLERASEIFSANQSYDNLFVSKWQAVIAAMEQNSPEPLLAFRKEASAKRLSECVRDADLFLLKVKFDQKLLDTLTFGTPMASYRERIRREVPRSPSESIIWGDETSKDFLDLQTGILIGGNRLSPGKKIHRVIAALLKDFYVPRNMGNLFSELYPDEYFDIHSSPLKVRQLLSRTRHWLRENGIPAGIHQVHGSYCFSIQGSFGVKIHLQNSPLESTSAHWQELKTKFPAGVPFSAKRACEFLHLPRSSFLVLADRALKAGELLRMGQGKATFYQIVDSSHFSQSPSPSCACVK